MKDNHELMIGFAKIVERHPELYDYNLEAYKTRHLNQTWEQVASTVRQELNEECTAEELKIKWKGIRSSFSRYKNKVLAESNNCKKYYLYDTLKFLDPFTKPKGPVLKGSSLYECGIYDDDDASNENSSSDNNWNVSDMKPNVSDIQIEYDPLGHKKVIALNGGETSNYLYTKKRKMSSEDKGQEDDNEDLQFFKSILPDIKNFTNQEKRKLKMGVLRLIDEIENDKKQK